MEVEIFALQQVLIKIAVAVQRRPGLRIMRRSTVPLNGVAGPVAGI
jgi:hypothetical protein